MTAEWIATYYEEGNPTNKIKFDLFESGGRSLLLDERGTGSFEFYRTIQRHGKTWILESRDSKPKTAPLPRDPEREEAIRNLEAALGRFPSPDALLAFYAGEPILESKINRNYDLNIEEMAEWCAKIAKTLAPPLFTQDQLRIKFTGQRIGPHLYVGAEKVPSCAANEWNGEFAVECHGCRTLKGATIRQIDILKMRAGLAPMFKCSNPCERLMR